jgi:hypothetical protein
MALFRFPNVPEELLPESLQDQPVPIPLLVAQEEELRNPADLWSAMDNEQRPSISCIVTLALNPYQPITGPLVRTRELWIGLSRQPQLQQLDEETEPDHFWSIGGRLRSAKPLEEVNLTLVETKQDIVLQPEGRFVVGNLKAGNYTLDVTVKGRKLNSYKVTVPSPDYDFEL